MDNAEAHQSVLDQVSLYGLTTVAATAPPPEKRSAAPFAVEAIVARPTSRLPRRIARLFSSPGSGTTVVLEVPK